MAVIFASTGNSVLYTGKETIIISDLKIGGRVSNITLVKYWKFWLWYAFIRTVYSSLMALLFSMFLVYDTQRIMGGKKHSISPEEHIWASIEIYIDVVYIFLAILGIGGRD